MLLSVRRHKGSAFSKALTLYLLDCGTKRRAIEVLSTLGVCCSWTTAQNVMGELAERAEGQVRRFGSLYNCYL